MILFHTSTEMTEFLLPGIFLCFQLSKHFDLGDTKAAELAGMMINKSDKTVLEWRTQFFENNGEIPEGKQGKYNTNGLVCCGQMKDLNKKATRYIRVNANVKGQPNLTVR